MVDQQGIERTPGQQSDPLAAQSSTMRPPGLITFAAVMLFILGGFHVLLAISEFANSTWVLTRLDTVLFIQFLFIWGIIDLIIGLIALFGGVSIFRGGQFGWVVGFVFATFGVIRWLFYVPASPVLAVVIIALDGLIIYGLGKHLDYFDEAR